MVHNMGKKEKASRLVGGALLFMISWLFLGAFSVFGGAVSGVGVLGFVLAVVGVVIFVTGVISYCPISALFKRNSCEACRMGETHKHMPV